MGYVVPRPAWGGDYGAEDLEDNDEADEDEEDDQDDGVVEEWGAVYDSAYAAADAVTEDPALNYSGYADSFNPGDVHVPHTVDEWADFTVKRVEQLQPTRVLELGCGNGMILTTVLDQGYLPEVRGHGPQWHGAGVRARCYYGHSTRT